MIRVSLILLMLVSFVNSSSGQKKNETIGFELDSFAYLTGGYNFALWYGYEGIRFRVVNSKSERPDFYIAFEFENNKITTYGLFVDYCIKPDFNEWWIGAGIEYRDASIKQINYNKSVFYDNIVLTVGGGYIWKIYDDLYLTPWIAARAIIGGPRDIKVVDEVFTQEFVSPEFSLKLGWHL